MKELILILIFSFSLILKSNSQSLIEVTDYLEYVVPKNSPIPSITNEFKVIEPEEGDTFFTGSKLFNKNKELVFMQFSHIYFKDVKSIIIEPLTLGKQKCLRIRLGLRLDDNSESFTASNPPYKSSKTDVAEILLANDLQIAKKIKNALIKLINLKGYRVSDLNKF